MLNRLILAPAVLVLLVCLCLWPQQLPREQWGAPLVTVSHVGGKWVIAGKKNRVLLEESNLALTVEAGPAIWKMVPSSDDDMLVKSRGQEFSLRLAAAGKSEITPYDTGYKTGVKIVLRDFRHKSPRTKGLPLDLTLFLTVALEGRNEELVFEAAANERETWVRELNWPKELDARDVDYTVLSNRKGTLLPRNWAKAYNPVRDERWASDTSVVQSNVVECWSMAWWGFQKGQSAMMVLVETPDDAGYKFEHPAGGPTLIGPRWRATLGRLGYPRTVRMSFFPRGNYVALCKRYRRYVMDTGHFVSLRDKMAREPLVKELIGTPHTRLHVLTNFKQDSDRYDAKNPANNYRLTTFDQRAEELRRLKARGIERLYVCLAGWPYLGYDRQHPDILPPAPAAGGWEGLKRLAETARELNYLFVLHDQFRDYYVDAPSYQEQFAVHEEDAARPSLAFPGTRFGQWKTGAIPFMKHWDGGQQTFLNGRFMLGHLVKNYELLFERGIKPQGSYLDVFGYVPPDEDFNPQHPVTRTDCLKFRAACFRWARSNLGLVGTEAAADWVIPYVDFGSSNPGAGRAIPVPLYELVYHDAIVSPFDSRRPEEALRALLYGGVPSLPAASVGDEKMLASVRQVAALHQRIALLEMTNHEFLDGNHRKERTTFADGTTVTVDWDAGLAKIDPPLKDAR